MFLSSSKTGAFVKWSAVWRTFFLNSKKVYEGKQVSKLIRTRIYQLYPNINFSFYFIDEDIFYISNKVTINEEVF